jgi:hypothetical protein
MTRTFPWIRECFTNEILICQWHTYNTPLQDSHKHMSWGMYWKHEYFHVSFWCSNSQTSKCYENSSHIIIVPLDKLCWNNIQGMISIKPMKLLFPIVKNIYLFSFHFFSIENATISVIASIFSIISFRKHSQRYQKPINELAKNSSKLR